MSIRTLCSFLALLVLLAATADGATSSVVEHYSELQNSNATPGDTKFLRKSKDTADDEARIDLVISLEKSPSEETRRTLEAIVLDTGQSDRVRMQAICSLGSSATRESVPLLINILEDDLQQRRGFWACVIPLLGHLKDRRAIPLLTRIANLNEDHLAGMNHMAIEALAEMGDKREVLLLCSKAYIEPVRFAVINGLARIASVESTVILIEALQGTEEPETSKVAEHGLLRIGNAAIPALKAAVSEIPEGWDDIYRSRMQQLIRQIQQ